TLVLVSLVFSGQNAPLGLVAGDFLFPFGHARLPVRRTTLKIGFHLAHLTPQLVHLLLFVGGIDDSDWLMVIVNKGKHPVVFLLSEWIEFMVVALSALDGEAEDALADCIHPVEHGVHPELLGINRPLLVDHGIAQKTGSHNLLLSRPGKLVSGKL